MSGSTEQAPDLLLTLVDLYSSHALFYITLKLQKKLNVVTYLPLLKYTCENTYKVVN